MDNIMTPGQARGLRIVIVVFAIVATLYMYYQGALQSMSFGGFGILAIAYGAVAFFVHKYIKSSPDRFEKKP